MLAMTTKEQLPEEATEEPRTLSPEEDTERAARRVERSASLESADEAASLSDPDNPLRIPGELSSKPRERAREEAEGKHSGE
jgi:hypothetical protein